MLTQIAYSAPAVIITVKLALLAQRFLLFSGAANGKSFDVILLFSLRERQEACHEKARLKPAKQLSKWLSTPTAEGIGPTEKQRSELPQAQYTA